MMDKFNRLEDYSDDELIVIVYYEYEKEEWQKEAVDYAKYLLLERGISDDFAQIRIKEIVNEFDLSCENEFESRKLESFSIHELIYMFFFWPRCIIWDWFLNRNGYAKKRKQRLYAIGGGILFYSITVLIIVINADKMEGKRIQEINQKAKVDSISMSKIDWSGHYIFLDTTQGQTRKMVWELNVQKSKLGHTAKLKLIDKNETILISCVGLVKKDGFEFYPDTTYLLYNGLTISYYDRLFTFGRDSNKIFTSWDKMQPFYLSKYNGIGLFKEIAITN